MGPSRFPQKTTKGRGQSSGRRSPTQGRRGREERTRPTAHGKGDREIQTEREEKKEKRVISRPGGHP